MIKVIKEGKKIPIYKIECPCCDSVLSYTENDEQIKGIKYGGYYTIFFISCPICTNEIMTRKHEWF